MLPPIFPVKDHHDFVNLEGKYVLLSPDQTIIEHEQTQLQQPRAKIAYVKAHNLLLEETFTFLSYRNVQKSSQEKKLHHLTNALASSIWTHVDQQNELQKLKVNLKDNILQNQKIVESGELILFQDVMICYKPLYARELTFTELSHLLAELENDRAYFEGCKNKTAIQTICGLLSKHISATPKAKL